MSDAVVITVTLPVETGARLTELARATEQDAEALVRGAIERMVAEESDRLERVATGLREAAAGNVVPGEQVHTWMRSWFSDDELPPP
jgi:predicted transcriptional regulator